MSEARAVEGALGAVVTGAGSGIGRSTAEQLGARGLHVFCVGRTAATVDEAVAAIAAAGGSGEAVVADVGTPAGVDAVTAAVGGRQLQALIHVAGNNMALPFVETTRAQLSQLVDINLGAPFFLTQALLGQLVDGAGVVFVGSVSASRGRDRHAAYGASKAALYGLTVNLAAELAPRVRVNTVSPGATDTGMLAAYVTQSTAHLTADQAKRVRTADSARILLRRIARPDEVATPAVHLALDATAVTGVDLPVDVGYTAS